MAIRFKQASGGKTTSLEEIDGFPFQRTTDDQPAQGADHYVNYLDLSASIVADAKTDVDIADAISKKHTQNTDTQFSNGYGETHLKELWDNNIVVGKWMPPVGGYKFTGSNYVTVPYNKYAVPANGDFVVDTWIRTEYYGSGLYPRIFNFHDGTTGLLGFIEPLGRLRLKFGSVAAQTFDTVIADGEPHHIQIKVSRHDNLITVFIDGKQEATTYDISADTSDITSTEDITIGGNVTPANCFIGEIYDFHIHADGNDYIESRYNNGVINPNVPYEYQGGKANAQTDGEMEGTISDSWTVLGGNTLDTETTIVHNGLQSAKIVAVDTNALLVGKVGANDWRVIGAKIGRYARVRAWIYVVSGWSSGNIELNDSASTPSYTVVKKWEQGTSPTDTWVELESIVEITQLGTASPRIRAMGSVASGDVIYIDDVSIDLLGETIGLRPKKAGQNAWVGELGGEPVIAETYGDPIAIGGESDGATVATSGGATTKNLANSQKAGYAIESIVAINNSGASQTVNIYQDDGERKIVDSYSLGIGAQVALPIVPGTEFQSATEDKDINIECSVLGADGVDFIITYKKIF